MAKPASSKINDSHGLGNDGKEDEDTEAGGNEDDGYEHEHEHEHGHELNQKSDDKRVGEGRALEEKEISSPFPFLDVASALIIQLAEAE